MIFYDLSTPIFFMQNKKVKRVLDKKLIMC